MRRLLGVAALIAPCALLFAAFMLAGCAETQPGRRDFVMVDEQGADLAWIKPSGKVVIAPGKDASKVIVALVKVIKLTSDQLNNVRDNLAKATRPPEKPVDKEFEKLSAESVAATDAKFCLKALRENDEWLANAICPKDCDVLAGYSSDLEMGKFLRDQVFERVRKCRTGKQEEALDRMTERLPGKPLPTPSLLRENP